LRRPHWLARKDRKLICVAEPLRATGSQPDQLQLAKHWGFGAEHHPRAARSRVFSAQTKLGFRHVASKTHDGNERHLPARLIEPSGDDS
jgi:hypothetical protein